MGMELGKLQVSTAKIFRPLRVSILPYKIKYFRYNQLGLLKELPQSGLFLQINSPKRCGGWAGKVASPKVQQEDTTAAGGKQQKVADTQGGRKG